MEWLVDIHSVWRYLVLVTALGSLALASMAIAGARPWDRLSDRIALAFTVAMDVQVVIGSLVWVLAFSARDVAFLAWIHPVGMLVATGLAHIGKVRAERQPDDRARGRAAALFFAASLVLVILLIPAASWPL